MTIFLVIFAALAPVAWLLWTIYRKDSAQPEPAKWLVKAFVYGVLSLFLSLCVSWPTSVVFGLEFSKHTCSSVLEAVTHSFLLAAIPEELAKLFMLWLLLRKNPFFDEHFDGIVYAVCVSLGFAALENICYLFGGLGDGTWIRTGIVRALFTVPGHYFNAIFMGYYYSLYHFGIDRSLKTKVMILVAPILAHGIFNSILGSMQVIIDVSLGGWFLLVILFFFFFIKLRKRANERLESLMDKRS